MMRDDEMLGRARPRVRLTALPSPLERAERFEMVLRATARRVPRIYLKRDDLLSLGMGGNKIRNLEFLLGAALAEGATDVVTAGRQQSNHCRLTAAACARAGGLRAHIVLSGDEPAVYTGNLLLDRLLGAEMHFVGGPADDREARARKMAAVAAGITRRGGRPFVIAVGGSDVAGTFGHVLAAGEIASQLGELGEAAACVVLATATGGTQAGMLAGFRKLGVRVRVVGFTVAKGGPELSADMRDMARSVSGEIGVAPPVDDEIVVDGTMLGEGYGVPSAAGAEAIELLARSEGVLCDPVYTGKALAGLVAAVRRGAFAPEECVVFVHTGGLPALFAELPATSA